MCEQNASYLVKDSKLGVKNLNSIFLKNCTKSTKMAITLSKFSKNFRGIVPRTPLELFLFLDLPRSNSAGKKSLPPLKKNVNTPLTQNIFKELITFFSGSKRPTSLHLVNILPYLKSHSLPKFSGSRLEISRFNKKQCKTIDNFGMLSWLAMECSLSLLLVSIACVSSVDRLTNNFVKSLRDCIGQLFVLRTQCKFSTISCSRFFISFVPLLSVNFAPNSFCFSIFCLGEAPQILPQALSS